MSTRPNSSTLLTQRKIHRSQDQRDAQGGSKAKAEAKAVLVNNAAFQEHAESLEDLDDRRWQETLDTNVGGYIRMARAGCRTSSAVRRSSTPGR